MSDDKEELVLTGLDKLDDPQSLSRLREAVNSRLSRVDLPDFLLEIAARTGFTSKFTHVTERDSRADDLGTSLCAVLIASNLSFAERILSVSSRPDNCCATSASSLLFSSARMRCTSSTVTLCCAEPSTHPPLGDRAAFASGAS
jgi:Tn3 transposase DDE domain